MNLLQCSMASRATRSQARCDHFLAVARNLFATNGFHRTGMAQLATASGVKVGQIYRDFASKEDIVAAIVEDDLGNFLEEDTLRDAVETRDEEGVRRWLSNFFAAKHDEADDHRLMPEILAEAHRNPRIAALQEAIETRVRASLVSALHALVPAAPDDARHALVDLILALGLGLHHRRLVESREVTERLAIRMRAIVDRELGALTTA